VVVADKARFPRDKCCGDGLTTGALRQLDELGLDPSSIASWKTVDDVTLRSPSGRETVFPLPAGAGQYAVVARRSELDAALVDRVRYEGATVLEGHEVTSVTQDATGVTAAVADGIGSLRVRARAMIAADGMWSPTRKLLGAAEHGYRGEWHAFRHYVQYVDGPAADRLLVWFEADLLPGYAWSFPLAGGAANVGFGIQRGGGLGIQDMKSLWVDLLQRPHVVAALGGNAKPEGPHRAWPIPARLGELPLAVGRALFVGDAAAATDPMTGEGIGQALATGRYAVEAITSAGLDSPEQAALIYRRRLEQGMVRDHRLARTLSGLLANRWATEFAIGAASSTDWTRRNFARWLFEDYPRAMLATPSRWSLGRSRAAPFTNS
jgi:geranylgeranyl reductase family protein